MSRIDFDRAFAKTPDCIHSAIEMGIRKGQKKMKLQSKIISLAALAAGLAVTIAMAALAAGGFSAAPGPDVLTQSAVTDERLHTPEPADEEPMVYCTGGGTYYHAYSDCSGMLGAALVPLEEAAQQKEPCPLCIAPIHVFCTPKGNYYHSDRSCCGMVGATAMSAEEAQWWNKQPCPICISTRVVYFAAGGKYYHNEPYCGSEHYEHSGKLLYALSAGMINCPDCMDEAVSEADENQDGFWAELKTQTEASPQPFSWEEPPVYITENGIYIHYDSICCGISGAQSLSYAQAQATGRISCPVCGSNSRERVYATENGKYYHCVENCSGMQRALATTPVEAQWEGKWACPVCMVPYVYELEMEGSIRSSAYLQRLIPDTNSGLVLNDFVYTALGENCFHLDADCSSSPKEHETLELAIARNQLPCPECIGSLPKDYDLFETAFGQDLDALWENWRYSHCYLDDLKAGCYSWIFTNGRDTSPACSVFDRRATDNYQLDIYFKSQKDSLRFLESVTAEPFSHIYPLAMEMARQHLQDTGRYEERENLYADALTILFDKNRQVSDSIMHFKAFEEPFTIEFRILENGEFESSIRS